MKPNVSKIKFTLLKQSFCTVCKKQVLHEYGMHTETKIHYKQCISCETLTEVKEQ
ncbi:MAG TPA: hypothetical protein PLA71_01110 [Saccharofermentans sp.]|nr:hypothetical protein [Saccharofermentans sp.]